MTTMSGEDENENDEDYEAATENHSIKVVPNGTLTKEKHPS